MAPYDRIDVRDYSPFAQAYRVSDLVRDHAEDIKTDIETNSPRHYPFCVLQAGGVRTVQGGLPDAMHTHPDRLHSQR